MPDEIQTKQQLEQADAPAKKLMAVDARGLIVAEDHEQLYRQAQMWLRSRICPESLDTVEKILVAHQTLAALGVNPLPNLRFCAYIKNSLVIFGDLPLTLVNMAGLLAQRPMEYLVDEQYNRICIDNKNLHKPVYAAVCSMLPKGDGELWQTRTYTFADAEVAGKIPARSPSPWKHFPNRMLQMKARGHLIKDLFPEILNGVGQAEYDHDALPEMSSIKSANPAPQTDLNDVYGGDI